VATITNWMPFLHIYS